MKKLVLIIFMILIVISAPQFIMAADFEQSIVPTEGVASGFTTSFSVDGKEYELPTYDIYSNYFFKLRDIATIMSGTEKEFAISWDGAKQTVHINAGQSYTTFGTEMEGVAREKPFGRSSAKFHINGAETPLTSYIINDEHYVKIYDISKKLDFLVNWDEQAVILTIADTKPYAGLEGADTPISYADAASWYLLPENTDKAVDCFYVLPTCWSKQNPNEPNFAQIDNPTLITGASRTYNNGGITYDEDCNMYVPYYRQLDAVVRGDMSIAEQQALMAELPVKDVISAFDYYIKNYNNGKPFIIAGHSQGSDVCRYILSEYMKENPDVYKRMVAAYPIGFAITSDFLDENPHLKFAENADDTGVIISYNTEAEGFNLPSHVVWENNLAINPISWTLDETTAVSGLASRMSIDGEYVEIAGMANATVNKERGVVNISGVDLDKYAPGNEVFPRGSLHGLDYPLYFNDIRENVKNRIEKYFESAEAAEYVKSSLALMPDKTVRRGQSLFEAR